MFRIKEEKGVGGDSRVSERVSEELLRATTLKSVGPVEKSEMELSMREVQLIDIWNDLLGRWTKRAKDAAIVSASLLDSMPKMSCHCP